MGEAWVQYGNKGTDLAGRIRISVVGKGGIITSAQENVSHSNAAGQIYAPLGVPLANPTDFTQDHPTMPLLVTFPHFDCRVQSALSSCCVIQPNLLLFRNSNRLDLIIA